MVKWLEAEGVVRVEPRLESPVRYWACVGWLCAEGLFSVHEAQYAPPLPQKILKTGKQRNLPLTLSQVSSAPILPRAVGDGGKLAVPTLCGSLCSHPHPCPPVECGSHLLASSASIRSRSGSASSQSRMVSLSSPLWKVREGQGVLTSDRGVRRV